MSTLAPTLQAFFTDRLIAQRQASGHTIAAYRDTWKLVLAFASGQLRKPPSRLQVTDLDAPLIGAFLDHLETVRGNGAATRNARLAAIHSLFRYAALRHPEDAAVIARVLAIPPKRSDRTLITYLTEDEITALLAAPDRATWTGRRDHALLTLACQTGLRATELITLATGDACLGTGAHVGWHRQGPQTADHPADQQHRQRAAGMAGRTRRAAPRPAVPHPARHPTQPRRPGTTRRQARRHRRNCLPGASRKENIAPRHAPLGRNAVAERGHRHLGHRVVAGPRERDHHPGLYPR